MHEVGVLADDADDAGEVGRVEVAQVDAVDGDPAEVGSCSRATRPASVVLPDPVSPTRASVVPGGHGTSVDVRFEGLGRSREPG